jgi:hypothetical protein
LAFFLITSLAPAIAVRFGVVAQLRAAGKIAARTRIRQQSLHAQPYWQSHAHTGSAASACCPAFVRIKAGEFPGRTAAW